MRVLVSGATGFLGKYVCRALLESGHSVTACHRAGSSVDWLGSIGVNLVEASLTEPAALESAFRGHDAVIHAAADIQSWPSDPARQFRTNVDGARNVALACRSAGIRRLVHVSSVSAIGIPGDDTPADEQFRFNLAGRRFAYHRSKKKAEEAVLDACGTAVEAVIVNPASLCGPLLEGAGFRGAELLGKGRGRTWAPVFGGGRCFVHAQDVAMGIVAALDRGRSGERYILGGDNVSFPRIAASSAAAFGEKRHFIPVPKAAAELTGVAGQLLITLTGKAPFFAVHHCDGRFQYYASGKARRELNYSPRDFAGILEEFISGAPRGPGRHESVPSN